MIRVETEIFSVTNGNPRNPNFRLAQISTISRLFGGGHCTPSLWGESLPKTKVGIVVSRIVLFSHGTAHIYRYQPFLPLTLSMKLELSGVNIARVVGFDFLETWKK